MNNENSPNTTTLDNFQTEEVKVLENEQTLQVTGGLDIDIFTEPIAVESVLFELGTVDLF